MKKYINGKLSIVNVVSYLEPFLIYTDDLTFMQYRDIVEFIDNKISEYNKNFIDRSRLFKVINEFKKENIIFSKAFTIIDILEKKMQEQVLEEGYDIITDKPIHTNTEILKKMLVKDNTKLYTSALSLQNISLMFPNEFSTLFSDEKSKLDKKLLQEEQADKCNTFVIAKYYSSLDELKNDDDKTFGWICGKAYLF
jgi:predicted HTH domain antitoxin